MKNTWVKIVLMGLLLFVVIAPFAGLAPLMLFLVVYGIGSILWSLLRTLVLGETDRENETVKLQSPSRE